ncbi:MAG TPA: PAS domain-containing protein, partial [Verrucomicrobiae bacterium]|nr:PAS domain-containing protein [Verrucomicrobiae bacterium]
MHYLNQFGLDLYFTRESLKTGVLVSLLSVWVLVGLFYYLNRYTKRRYFTIWTAAWLFYALWITLSFGLQGEKPEPMIMMFEDWCVGVAAVFLLWGSQQFLGERVRQQSLGWFMAFLLVWSYIGAYYLDKPLQTQLPLFGLIGVASLLAARSFLKYRRQHQYVGATLLMLGFALWGAYMMAYPFMEDSGDLVSLALFLSAMVQIFLAVSMIILVLEEVRHTHQIAMEQIHSGRLERAALQTQVASTEERYRQLFDQAGEAILIVHAEDLRLLELNRAAEHLLGIPQAEAGRRLLTSFCQLEVSGKSNPQTGGEWVQLICSQQPLNLIRKDGSVVPVEANGARINFG